MNKVYLALLFCLPLSAHADRATMAVKDFKFRVVTKERDVKITAAAAQAKINFCAGFCTGQGVSRSVPIHVEGQDFMFRGELSFSAAKTFEQFHDCAVQVIVYGKTNAGNAIKVTRILDSATTRQDCVSGIPKGNYVSQQLELISFINQDGERQFTLSTTAGPTSD